MDMDFKLLINGKFVDSPKTMDVVNPATEEVIAKCPRADKALAESAIQAANQAFPSWSATPIQQRADCISKFADMMETHKQALASLLTKEQGKPLAESQAEVDYSIAYARYFAGLTLEPKLVHEDETCKVEEHHIPLGVVGAIIPWNFPLLVLNFKLPPALLAGNTIVVKPSPTTPLVTLHLIALCKDVFPAGVLNVITDQNDLGSYLTGHDNVAKISFTGSTETGKKVMANAAGTIKRLTLELGGNDPAIVLADANIDSTAENIFGTAFVNCGQVCIAIKRTYVHSSIHDQLCEKLVELANQAIVGDGSEQGTTIGPLQNKQQFEKVKGFLDSAKKDGHIIAGGKLLARAGYFMEPTLVTDVQDGDDIVDKEQFGPILPIVKYENIGDVINTINAQPYGLGASVWSSDDTQALDLAQKVNAGTVWVNQHFAIAPNIPFAGARQSGLGVEFSEAGLLEYTQVKIVNLGK